MATPFPWARSAIVCLAGYHSAQPRSTDPAPAGAAWIARYAWSSRLDANGERRPSDYHKVLLKRLRTLESLLHEEHGEFQSRAYVDTGPVVERALATAAGLGWTAKNTCLIHPRVGSYAFLAVLLTSLEPAPRVHSPDRARSLRKLPPLPRRLPNRCLVCPLPDGCGQVHLLPDHRTSRTCRSRSDGRHGTPGFWLRHLPGRLPVESQGSGQRRSGAGAAAGTRQPSSRDPRSLDEKSFEETFNGSPVRRAGFAGLMRNVAIAMGNSGEVRFREKLSSWVEAADEGLRTAARWALARLERARE